ncbi:MAG: hypothetical protein ACTSRC_12560 [Candidatus Helarchaeota archaeon]
MRVIDEIWIIKPGGLTVFNLSKEENVDPLLMGGFFSAIQTLATQIGEKELKTLLFGNSKITIYQGQKGYLFISRSSKKVNDKLIDKSLKLVETSFFEKYGKNLEAFHSNSNLFDDFEAVIEEIFADTPEKRTEEALW